MARKIKRGILFLSTILLGTTLSAQTDEWKTATSKNGKVTAKYHFSTRVNEDGDNVPLVQAITSTKTDIGIENCISLMKNVSKHKDFRGEKISRLIKTVSENEWLIYYYDDKRLITPSVDGSYKMILAEDKQNKTVTFTITADPTLIKKTDASRITYVQEIYSFRELENGQLEITIKTTASPGFKVPAILMKKAFPKKLFDTMEKFIQVSSMEKKENTFQTKTD